MTTEHQDAQPVLPPLPEPDWYAVDTPGADSDVTLTKDHVEALELSGDGLPDVSKITSLYAGGHVRAIVRAALAAQQAAEPVCEVATVYDPRTCFVTSLTRYVKPGTKLYTHAPATPQAEPVGDLPLVITEEMHAAACKVLLRSAGLDGLPQRMLDAMRATTPPQAVQPPAAIAAMLNPAPIDPEIQRVVNDRFYDLFDSRHVQPQGEPSEAPADIWLQINADGSAEDTGYPADHEGVTWCWRSIGGQEVRYVRADLALRPSPEPDTRAVRVPMSRHDIVVMQFRLGPNFNDMTIGNLEAIVRAVESHGITQPQGQQGQEGGAA